MELASRTTDVLESGPGTIWQLSRADSIFPMDVRFTPAGLPAAPAGESLLRSVGHGF